MTSPFTCTVTGLGFQMLDYPYAWHEHYRLPDMSRPDEYRPPGWSATDEENHRKYWGTRVYPCGWSSRDWERHRDYLRNRRQRADELEAWHTEQLPRLVEIERHRKPLHADLRREFAAYSGRNIWIYFQLQTRPIKEVAGLVGLTTGRVRDIATQVERRLIRRANIKPFEHRTSSRPIDMGGPRDEWLEFTAPMALRTLDPRVEDLGP